jgi:hypothetical protein
MQSLLTRSTPHPNYPIVENQASGRTFDMSLAAIRDLRWHDSRRKQYETNRDPSPHPSSIKLKPGGN